MIHTLVRETTLRCVDDKHTPPTRRCKLIQFSNTLCIPQGAVALDRLMKKEKKRVIDNNENTIYIGDIINTGTTRTKHTGKQALLVYL